ncbi:MAG TPA: TonB-dependent receptor [Acidobacteriaceae bacterium]|nr:TonB-dependent receptor [Acidobacteriaceae bacterium]
MRRFPLLTAISTALPLCAQQQSPSVVVQPSTTQTVVVTASSNPLALAGSDRTVVVLDTQSQPLLFEALPDVLRLDPSLNLQERGPDGVQADLSIRGTTFEESLILLNGMRVDDPETGHFNLDIPVPLDAVNRAEVLHGAGSAFYGSDAIAGAVDLITAEPERPAGTGSSNVSLRARAGYGSFSSTEQHLIGDYAGGRFSEQLAGSRDTSAGFSTDRNYRSEALSSESWLHTSLGTTDVLLAGSDRPFGANQFYGPYESFEHTKGWLAMLQQQLGQRTQAGFSYRRHTDVYILEVADPAFYENNHIDEAWQGVVRRTDTLGKGLQLSTGVDGSADTIRSSSLGRHGRNQGAGYASLDLRGWSRFTLSVGGREEVFSGGAQDFSPTVAAGYRLRDNLRLRASAGHAFRLPTYTDLYYSDPATVGNPLLKPETSWSYEGGLTWTPSGRASLELTGFQNRLGNSIDYIKPSLDAKYAATNTGALAFSGAETALHLRLGTSQQLDLGYTGVHASRDLAPGLISAYVFNYAAQSALFSWSAVIRHQIVARTQVEVVQRVGHTAYPLWSTSIARSTGRIQPYLRLANLSNTGYQELPGVPMPGRSITGGVAFTWAKHR